MNSPPSDGLCPWMNLPGSHVHWREGKPPSTEVPVSIAMGIFDGVHLGHQAVLRSALERAHAISGIAAVLTFTPHPSRVLRPDEPTRLLFTAEAKERGLFQCGIEAVIWKAFDAPFARLAAEAFVEMLPKAFPGLASLHIGENFRFGQMRAGTPQLLRERLARHEITVEAVPRFEWQGDAVSSTRLRQAISEGRIEDANTMFGEPYRSTSRIAPGRQLGSTLGFPTFNLPYNPESRPRLGVYAVRVSGHGAENLPAVANYGMRPTVETAATVPLLEVHLLGEVPSWKVGERLTVEWLSFLRPEQRFDGLDALKAQIAADVACARDLFSQARGD